ncbi:hypothetical protein HY635_03900 [Candidatus Uhrbacteria bacterium]|nr:hypothetical protein [Candidatus Uhrbacteria bacterium]
MGPPHTEAIQPAVPDRAADDAQRWFAQRMDFQLALVRRMMRVDRLTDDAMMQWASLHAAHFADIVDAKDTEGEELRRLIREDVEAALQRVEQRMLH